MNDQVLRRKVQRPRPRPAPEVARSGLARALPRALVRAIGTGTGLTAQIGAMSEARLSLDEVLDKVADDGFIATLAHSDPAGTPTRGLLAVDYGLFSAVIEAMTLGRLATTGPAAPRRPTATDGALLGAVIDLFLTDLCTSLPAEDTGATVGAGRWHMDRVVNDLRLLGAILDDGLYRLAEVTVRLTAGGAAATDGRDGRLMLLLPEPAAQVAQVAPVARPGAEVAAPTGPDPFGAALEVVVADTAAVLGAVLGRVALPLDQALALAVGQRLELPISRLEEVEVVGLDLRPHAVARLGQSRGMRAVRIVSIPGDEGGSGFRSSPLRTGAE